jgi:prevent-host-death family protein
MDIARDIRTLEDLKHNTAGVLRDLRTRRRPVVITSKGEPEMLIIPAALFKRRWTALKAACELANV